MPSLNHENNNGDNRTPKPHILAGVPEARRAVPPSDLVELEKLRPNLSGQGL